MANYFMLIPKGTDGKAEDLQDVDDKMRRHFGAEPSATEWYQNWYNTIGFGLSLGRSFPELKEHFKEFSDLVEVTDWLDSHYTVNAWAGR